MQLRRTLPLLLALSCACKPGGLTLDEGEVGDGSGSDTAGTSETSTETGQPAETGDTAEPEPAPCGCVDLELVCDQASDEAMYDCALPSPCGTVNGDAAAAECVLELLIDQEPARFRYDIDSQDDTEGWTGWFYILGPGVGVDNECHREGWDFGVDWTPSGTHYSLEAPAYFADCIGKSASVMTGCIFNGLSAGSALAECPG